VVSEVFTGMPVDDFATAYAWYEIFAGRPADVRPEPGEAGWQIAGAGWIRVVADAARAGSALLTLVVDSLEEHVGFLAMRGIAPESIETVPGVLRRATILDPAGNTITIAQPFAADAAGARGR
jgi:hypothetical protein